MNVWLLCAALYAAPPAPSVAVLPLVPADGSNAWLGYVVADNLESAFLRHTSGKPLAKGGRPSLSVFSWRQAVSASRHDGLDAKKILSAAQVKQLGKAMGTRFVVDGSYKLVSGAKPKVLLKWRVTDLKGRGKAKTGKVKTNPATLAKHTDKLAATVLKKLGAKGAPKKSGDKNVTFEALRFYGKGLEIMANQSLNPRAQLVLDLGQVRRAHGFFGAAIGESPKMLRAWVARSVATSMRGKNELAKQELKISTDQTGELDPMNVLGRAYLYDRVGEPDRTVGVLAEATAKHPGFLLALGYLGIAHFRSGAFAKARDVFTTYRSRVPDSPWASMMVARAHAYLDDHPAALKIMKGLHKKHSRSAAVIESYASRLAQAGQQQEAKKLLEKALGKNKDHPALLTRLAYVEIKLGEADNAVTHAKAAVKHLGAGRGELVAAYAHANLGHALALTGNAYEAKKAFDLAAELGLEIADRKRLLEDKTIAAVAKDSGIAKAEAPAVKDEGPDEVPVAPKDESGGGEGEEWDEKAKFDEGEDWAH